MSKSVTVKFDFIAPTHCSDEDVLTNCSSKDDTPLSVDEDITRV